MSTARLILKVVVVAAGSGSAFSPEVAALRDRCPAATRFVLVTATLPEHVFGELQERFPGIQAAMGPGLHRTAPGRCSCRIGSECMLNRQKQ